MKISIIKMKKHPIDELFAKKLAEHRQEPSQKAFEKFQARLQEKQTKRRGGVFAITRNWGYYAAAAGVVATLTVGILSQNYTDDTQVVARNDKPKQEETTKQLTSPITQGSNETFVAQAEIQKELNKTPALEKKQLYDIAVAKTPPNESAKKSVKHEMPKLIEEISTTDIALHQPKNVSQLEAEVLTAKKTTAVETFGGENTSISSKYSIGETVVVVIAPLEESTTIKPQAQVETGRLAENDEKEKSFLAKLYGEYKHFKYGEKVDLKRLGVKDVVARVDEGLLKEERDDVRDFVQRRISRMQKRE